MRAAIVVVLGLTACGRSEIYRPGLGEAAPKIELPAATMPQRACTPEAVSETFAPFIGCNDLRVVGADQAGRRYLDVRIDRAQAGLRTVDEFDLTLPGPAVTVWVDVYASAPLEVAELYCSDYGTLDRPTAQVTARAGRVHVRAGAPDSHGRYRASVTLDELVFDDGSTLCHVELPDVVVGWFPG